jgi:hypothetical protein
VNEVLQDLKAQKAKQEASVFMVLKVKWELRVHEVLKVK